MNKKLKITIPAIIAIVILLLIIPKINTSGSKRRGPGGEARSKAPVNVNVVVIKPEQLENNILATGTVLANEEVELRSEISGKIIKIHFKEGSSVRKGDLLLKINDSDLQAQLLKASYYKKLAEQKEYRQKMLLQREGISQEVYDIALNELNTQEAEIQLIKAQIAKTEIRAPFDGTIGLKSVSDGSYISPTSKIATLQNTNLLKIDFSVPEKYSTYVKKGNMISFSVQGDEKKHTAQIYAIEPRIDPVTRTLAIRAITKAKDASVHPGSFAKVELFLDEIKNAYMVPTESLVQDIKGTTLYIVKNGTVSPKPVQLGIRKDKTIQIASGVNPGDTVVTTGLMQIKPGSKVKITTANY